VAVNEEVAMPNEHCRVAPVGTSADIEACLSSTSPIVVLTHEAEARWR
jgi:hypothetical protein